MDNKEYELFELLVNVAKKIEEHLEKSSPFQ